MIVANHCIYYRTAEDVPVWGPGGLHRPLAACAERIVGHLVCDRGPGPREPAERLGICRDHWHLRRHNLSAPYRFEARR